MNPSTRSHLIEIATDKLAHNDPSHDFEHALRVLRNAEHILEHEHADPDIVVPAALLHDAVIYPKNDPRSVNAAEESAAFAHTTLSATPGFPREKIARVAAVIRECSFSKGVAPSSLESKVLQDADRLEATGAISIMRTFASTGQMQRPFYHPEDPFCDRRNPEPLSYALDLFYERLLVVGERMHTGTAKRMATERTEFLRMFLSELRREIS